MQDIKVIRSKRKTLSLQVDESCTIIVRAPLRCSDKTITMFIESKRDWLSKTLQIQKERQGKRVVLNDAQIDELKKKAKEYLPDKIEYYSNLMNVKPNGFKVTSAKKRFGSCSTNDSLCFSYLLMLYPEEAIDYVVVHELAHIKHHNHQKEFYQFIEEVLPDYKSREKLLKKFVT